MKILENSELIEKINDLHRNYADDFDLLIPIKDKALDLYSHLRGVKAIMNHKADVNIDLIVKPNIYNEILKKLSLNLLTNISSLMATYHVPTPNFFYDISDRSEKDFFISYNDLLKKTEKMLLGNSFTHYKNMSIAKTFKSKLNDIRGKSVYLHLPYKRVLIDKLIQTINIYISGNAFSDIDDKVKYELTTNRKFSYSYPNFDVKIPKSGDKYTVTFHDRESAEKFYNFLSRI
jgi:hypothetical protein